MTNERPVSVIVFDVNETLLDITTLELLFERVFGDARVMREWFTQLILYSQTMTLSGLYMPFAALGVGTLQMLAAIHEVSVEDDELKLRMNTMPTHDDVTPALTHLRDAGFRLVTLTNSAPAVSPTPLQRAGLDGFFDRMFSVDDVRQYKPAPQTYRLVADELRVDISELCLVACHLWDTIGAQAVGGHGALVTRPYNAIIPNTDVPTPDIVD